MPPARRLPRQNPMPSLQLFLLFLAADARLKLTPGPDMALTLSVA